MGNMSREVSAGDGGLGEFPGGEFPAQGQETAGGEGEAQESSGSEGDPGFGGADGSGTSAEAGIPDLSDEEPSLEEAMASFEDAVGEGTAEGSQGPAGSGSQSGSGASPGGRIPGQPPGSYGNEPPGAGGYGSGTSGRGPLTTAEQVAILDAQLEQGAGDFDAMILKEQNAQRQTSRERAATRTPPSAPSGGGGGSGSAYDPGGVADAGGYSAGGGMGGVSAGGGGIPQNTAKYPPPGDIPAGSDDDVVARQLREAAMREPNPALREKLWDEYRKYKGIN